MEHGARNCRYMANLRFLTALRRATHITQGFGQCRVICESGVYQYREFSNRKTITLDDEGTETKPKQRPKTVPVPKITLLSPDNSMTVTKLENAERLAKRRKLNLIKVSDPDNKTCRATYKLTNSLIEGAEILQDNTTDKEKSKSPKLLYISATITKHDLSVKMKNVLRLLNKGNKVKICITLDDNTENDVLNTITEMVKDIGSIQKPTSKKKTIVLLITPLDKKETTAAPSSQGDNM